MAIPTPFSENVDNGTDMLVISSVGSPTETSAPNASSDLAFGDQVRFQQHSNLICVMRSHHVDQVNPSSCTRNFL